MHINFDFLVGGTPKNSNFLPIDQKITALYSWKDIDKNRYIN